MLPELRVLLPDECRLKEDLQEMSANLSKSRVSSSWLVYTICELKCLTTVPGLVDNSQQGVKRGKFSLSGSEIVQIFSPVLDEVVALVIGQIKSTKREVKAVLLVGGFGESAYLRKSLRQAVGSKVEILVPPNR